MKNKLLDFLLGVGAGVLFALAACQLCPRKPVTLWISSDGKSVTVQRMGTNVPAFLMKINIPPGGAAGSELEIP